MRGSSLPRPRPIALIAIVASLLQEDRYESHADVFLSGTSSIPGDFGYEQQRDIDPERAGNTQARLARVPERRSA